jgi:RNA ligase (TIGR02306 family)
MKFPLKIIKTNKTVLEQIEQDILTFDYSKQRSIYSSGEIYTFKVDDTILVDSNDKKVLLSDLLNTIDDHLKCQFHNKLLVEGEQVVITEKIHGAQFRACYTNKRFYLGSRNTWGRESNNNDWSKAASPYKLQEKLKNYPDLVLYGEVYGDVQDLKYGMKQNEVDLVVFDFMNIKTRKFLDFEDTKKLCEELQIPHVPILYQGPWNEELKSLCEGKTTIQGANHVREGIVVKRIQEIPDPHFGRVILKLPGEGYLLRKVKDNS